MIAIFYSFLQVFVLIGALSIVYLVGVYVLVPEGTASGQVQREIHTVRNGEIVVKVKERGE